LASVSGFEEARKSGGTDLGDEEGGCEAPCWFLAVVTGSERRIAGLGRSAARR
jgi:hypothetical protein